MKKHVTDQAGFSFLPILLVLVVIVAIVLVGMRVMNSSHNSLISDTAKGQTTVPSKVASKADLQQAASALDTTNVDGINVNQLDSAINGLY